MNFFRLFLVFAVLASSLFTAPCTQAAEKEIIIRIAVIRDSQGISLKTSNHKIIVREETGAKFRLSSNENYYFKAENGKINMSGHRLKSPLHFQIGKGKGKIQFGSSKFSGEVILYANEKGKLDIIEKLPLEKYLAGVVGAEMGPNWPFEALKAQAVASRSFAVRQLNPAKPYDVAATTDSQLYKVALQPNQKILRAIQLTKDEILYFDKKPLEAYFHSHCGGHTEDPTKVWLSTKKSVPKALKGIRDPYCIKAPTAKTWTATISEKTIMRLIKKQKSGVTKINQLRKGSLDESGRASILVAVTDKGNIEISANELRLKAGPTELKSTLISSITRNKDNFIFKGKGYGHGIGMCQWGARGMAERGRKYPKILQFYYPGTKLGKINE